MPADAFEAATRATLRGNGVGGDVMATPTSSDMRAKNESAASRSRRRVSSPSPLSSALRRASRVLGRGEAVRAEDLKIPKENVGDCDVDLELGQPLAPAGIDNVLAAARRPDQLSAPARRIVFLNIAPGHRHRVGQGAEGPQLLRGHLHDAGQPENLAEHLRQDPTREGLAPHHLALEPVRQDMDGPPQQPGRLVGDGVEKLLRRQVFQKLRQLLAVAFERALSFPDHLDDPRPMQRHVHADIVDDDIGLGRGQGARGLGISASAAQNSGQRST